MQFVSHADLQGRGLEAQLMVVAMAMGRQNCRMLRINAAPKDYSMLEMIAMNRRMDSTRFKHGGMQFFLFGEWVAISPRYGDTVLTQFVGEHLEDLQQVLFEVELG